MNHTENIGRCPRCHRLLIAEQSMAHVCNFAELPILGCEEVVLDRLSDMGKEQNGDHLYLAWGKNLAL